MKQTKLPEFIKTLKHDSMLESLDSDELGTVCSWTSTNEEFRRSYDSTAPVTYAPDYCFAQCPQ